MGIWEVTQAFLTPPIGTVGILDLYMNRVLRAIKRPSGEMLNIADHGNVKKMRDTNPNQPITSHTSGPAPLVYVE